MQHSQTHLRSRPISAGHLRAFEAVSRHLNFRAAAEEMALTQSCGQPPDSRHWRKKSESASSCATPARWSSRAPARSCFAPWSQARCRVVDAVRCAMIRQQRRTQRAWRITTFASFASMWLIPRLEAFQREHPDIDIRIDAIRRAGGPGRRPTCGHVALRYVKPGFHACRRMRCGMFGEQLTPVASPWLHQERTRRCANRRRPGAVRPDRGRVTRTASANLEVLLTWRRWLDAQGNSTRLDAQALAVLQLRPPDGAGRTDRPGPGAGPSCRWWPTVWPTATWWRCCRARGWTPPLAYWLIPGPRQSERAEVRAYSDWLRAQARATREAIGEVPDSDEGGDLD
jgi:LysR family glycine cleavage system transcriptional activator